MSLNFRIVIVLFCASVLKTCSKFLTAVSTYFYIIICFIDNIYKKYIKKKTPTNPFNANRSPRYIPMMPIHKILTFLRIQSCFKIHVNITRSGWSLRKNKIIFPVQRKTKTCFRLVLKISYFYI